MPFLLFLHGASGSGSRVLPRLGASPDGHGVAIAAPDSRDLSWDAVRADFGPDVRFIDRVLAAAFAKVAVDPARLAIGGFSDGATYALSLGLINGDLFRRVVAFSPGFIVDGPRTAGHRSSSRTADRTTSCRSTTRAGASSRRSARAAAT